MTTPSDEELLARLGEIPDRPSHGARPLPRLPTLPRTAARDDTRRRRLLALGASVLWFGSNLALLGLRKDLPQLPPVYLEAEVVLPCVLAAGCLAFALAAGRLGLGVKRAVVAVLVLLAPLAFGVLVAATPIPDAHAPGSASPVAMFVCMSLTLAWAALPLALAATTLRAAFPVASRWRSGLAGAAVGLCAGATINLHCPNVAHVHMLIGHGLPVAVATLLGALVVSHWARS
jgi:hypothetical protein